MNNKSVSKEIENRNEAIRQACSEIMAKRADELIQLALSYQSEFASRVIRLESATKGGQGNE